MGSTYPIQAFAQEGYAILRPNPRGSGGYAAEFRRANISDWGYGDFDDDMKGVEKDARVPISQGQELYIALKRRGIAVEMITYPRMPHGLNERKFIIDAGSRMIQWFNKQLRRSKM